MKVRQLFCSSSRSRHNFEVALPMLCLFLLLLVAEACGGARVVADVVGPSVGAHDVGLGSLPSVPRPSCKLAGPIINRVFISRGSRCEVLEIVKIQAGGELLIEPDVQLSFRRGAGLIVDGGKLRALGTSVEPVRFTSGEATPQPGDWTGIVAWNQPDPVGAQAGAVQVAHAVVEFGGACWSQQEVRACGGVVIRSVDPAIGPRLHRRALLTEASPSLEDVLLTRNAHAGLWLEHPAVRTTQLRFGSNEGLSAHILPHQVELLGRGPTEAVDMYGDLLETSTTWPSIPGGYIIRDLLVIMSLDAVTTHELTVLTIERGSTVYFGPGMGIQVGSMPGYAKLVAHGVTFSGLQRQAGYWGNIWFMGMTTYADLEDNVFEYGGTVRSPVLAFSGPPENYHVERNTFRFGGGAAMGVGRQRCADWLRTHDGNVSMDQPLCVKF